MNNHEKFNHGIPHDAMARSNAISGEVAELRNVLDAEFPKQEIANEVAKPVVKHETQLTLVNGEGKPDQASSQTPEEVVRAA